MLSYQDWVLENIQGGRQKGNLGKSIKRKKYCRSRRTAVTRRVKKESEDESEKESRASLPCFGQGQAYVHSRKEVEVSDDNFKKSVDYPEAILESDDGKTCVDCDREKVLYVPIDSRPKAFDYTDQFDLGGSCPIVSVLVKAEVHREVMDDEAIHEAKGDVSIQAPSVGEVLLTPTELSGSGQDTDVMEDEIGSGECPALDIWDKDTIFESKFSSLVHHKEEPSDGSRLNFHMGTNFRRHYLLKTPCDSSDSDVSESSKLDFLIDHFMALRFWQNRTIEEKNEVNEWVQDEAACVNEEPSYQEEGKNESDVETCLKSQEACQNQIFQNISELNSPFKNSPVERCSSTGSSKAADTSNEEVAVDFREETVLGGISRNDAENN